MLPTLAGRIQTRIFVLAVIGSLLTLAVTPLLGLAADLESAYGTTFRVLLAVAILGVVWEFLYHGLQQFRWEKDWPTLFGLITAVNEGALIFLLARARVLPGLEPLPPGAFMAHFLVVWIGTWAVINGPMRVPFIHWRFRGGRVL